MLISAAVLLTYSALLRHDRLLLGAHRARPVLSTVSYPRAGFTARSAEEATVAKLLNGDSAKWVTVTADEPVGLVAGKLSEAGRGSSALVCSDDPTPLVLGIFTERDYLKALNCCEGEEGAEECAVDTATEEALKAMSSPVQMHMTPAATLLTTPADTTIVTALRLMGDRGVRHLPVVGEAGAGDEGLRADNVLGVLSIGGLAEWVRKDTELLAESVKERRDALLDPRFQSGGNRGDVQRPLLLGLGAIAAATLLLFVQQDWISGHWQVAMVGTFVLGYVGIIFEELFDLNKGAVGLLMATVMWATYIEFSGMGTRGELTAQLSEHLAEVSDICFFLLAASTIVEVIDAHQGFKYLTDRLLVSSKTKLFWIVGVITFFLSAILNNLTVTIVMVSLLRKILADDDERKLFGAMVVIAANAGGVWTPIGDVTTTMLWMNGQLSTTHTVTDLFACSLASLVGSMAVLQGAVNEEVPLDAKAANASPTGSSAESASGSSGLVLGVGIGALLSVPVFVEQTGLPPFMGMLTGLAALWVLTDALHAEGKREDLQVPAALSKLDTSGILFFLGVLLAIGALDAAGLLKQLAEALSAAVPSNEIVAAIIGVASALIDNVPLVAATMGMYDLSSYPQDAQLWQLIAYCAGTGGSILVIGSASGVALMGLESVGRRRAGGSGGWWKGGAKGKGIASCSTSIPRARWTSSGSCARRASPPSLDIPWASAPTSHRARCSTSCRTSTRAVCRCEPELQSPPPGVLWKGAGEAGPPAATRQGHGGACACEAALECTAQCKKSQRRSCTSPR